LGEAHEKFFKVKGGLNQKRLGTPGLYVPLFLVVMVDYVSCFLPSFMYARQRDEESPLFVVVSL
jgi:hypothetical protein